MRSFNRSHRSTISAQNWLWIGYHAWCGYLTSDRGIVVISSDVDLLDDSDRCYEPQLNFRYLAQSQLSPYLQEWLLPARSIDSILLAVTNYQPNSELIFAIEASAIDIGWCQRLKTSPPDCYQQIWRRWQEFELNASPQ